MNRYALYVDGRWLPGDGRRVISSPWDDRPLAEVDWAGPAQVEQALESAARAFRAPMPATHIRSRWLQAIAEGLDHRLGEMSAVIGEEAGKPISLARIEVERAVGTFSLAAHHAMTWRDEAFPLDAVRFGEGRHCLTRRFPVGPVLAITPYNWPLNLAAHKVAPALAVGCPLLLRPASQTPVSSLLLAAIAEEAGVAQGFLQVVPCATGLAERMATDPRVRMVSFTGSPAVGWALKARCPEKRVVLELGGNAACIIEPEIDPEAIVARVALGCYGYAGQICISIQRLYVHRAIRDRFVAALDQDLRERFRTGDPRDPEVVCGPLISEQAADRVMEWLAEAEAAGAQVLIGGRRLGPRLIEPTLVEGVRPDLRLQREEVFGPVATLTTYESFDDALAMADDSPYGINCGVYTRDLEKAWRAFERLEVGCVIVNDYPTFRVDSMPYGGVKRSGFGREGVAYAMAEMTEIRGWILNPSIP